MNINNIVDGFWGFTINNEYFLSINKRKLFDINADERILCFNLLCLLKGNVFISYLTKLINGDCSLMAERGPVEPETRVRFSPFALKTIEKKRSAKCQ